MYVIDGTYLDDDTIDAEEIADGGEESGKPNNQESPFFTRALSSLVMITAKCWILMMTLIWRMKIRPNLMRKRRMT